MTRSCTNRTKEGELIYSMELFRGGLAVQERKFCERAERFIEHILSVEMVGQCGKANGLIFGTQTLTSLIINRKGRNQVTRDNLHVVEALCRYVAEANMVIGNLVNPRKADDKKELWLNEFSLAKKMKSVVTGPVSPAALKDRVEGYYRRHSSSLVVLMMDSGGHKDYTPVMYDLTRRYDNLYIMKMILIGSYGLKLLRAYRGKVGVMDNDRFEDCYRMVKRKGWEHVRKHPKLLDGLFEDLKRT